MSDERDREDPDGSSRPVHPVVAFVGTVFLLNLAAGLILNQIGCVVPAARGPVPIFACFAVAAWLAFAAMNRARRAWELWPEGQAHPSLPGAPASLPAQNDAASTGDRPTLMHGPKHGPEARD